MSLPRGGAGIAKRLAMAKIPGLRPSATSLNALPSCPVVAVIGSITMDTIFEIECMPGLGESRTAAALSVMHGGKGANTAVAAFRASRRRPVSGREINQVCDSKTQSGEISVFVNGAVGDDDEGRTLRAGLEQHGLDPTGIRMLEGERTGQAAVFVERLHGDGRAVAYRGANLNWLPRSDNLDCLSGNKGLRPDLLIIHCTVKLETIKKILELAREQGVETILNASPAVALENEIYGSITHLVVNEHEAAKLSDHLTEEFADISVAKQIAEEFVSRGVKYVLITLGEAGAVYATSDEDQRHSGYIRSVENVCVRDTTGAGDSFLGAYAIDYIRQKQEGTIDIEKAILFACRAAACTIEQLGSQTSLPWLDEIDQKS